MEAAVPSITIHENGDVTFRLDDRTVFVARGGPLRKWPSDYRANFAGVRATSTAVRSDRNRHQRDRCNCRTPLWANL